MPVAGGLVTMSRAQSANQEDHLADNVVKCVCTYCTHRIIYIIHKRTKSNQRGNQKKQQQPRRPSGRQCCQLCLRTSKQHILHYKYRNRCSKHRQRGDQDHLVDVVQRNNVCKHKLLYKSTWTMDPVEKCSVLFSFSLGTLDVYISGQFRSCG